ncbi:MAG: chemotaxis-specific protein-glutamate methyltransferase CheB [Deltaproteobacteria bacterium]|nr:chemotaxis-specific protein-glutamate methyltransferase CheB [Deltaproteobacteria bacterium]
MRPLKVLIVDDIRLMQQALQVVLADIPEVVIAGVANDGIEALEAIERLHPDLVILDIEMPKLDGLGVLRRLAPTPPPVILFSTHTKLGAPASIEGMRLGAVDFVAKPEGASLSKSLAAIRSDLTPKIKGFIAHRSAPPPLRPAAVPARAASTRARRTPEAVVFGSSTGGPPALLKVVPRLKPMGVPYLLVQHMPAHFPEQLAKRLDQISELTVKVPTDGEMLVGNTLYIAPGDRHMAVLKTGANVVIKLLDTAPLQSCKPSVDPLFESAAKVWRNRVSAFMLTGMGADGADGADAIHKAGGWVAVQSQETCVIWGMPRAVFERGLADEVVDLDQIADTVNGWF